MTNKQNTKQRKKKLKTSRGKKTYVVGWSFLLLLKAPPPTQESGEGVLIDKVKQQGATMNSLILKTNSQKKIINL